MRLILGGDWLIWKEYWQAVTGDLMTLAIRHLNMTQGRKCLRQSVRHPRH